MLQVHALHIDHVFHANSQAHTGNTRKYWDTSHAYADAYMQIHPLTFLCRGHTPGALQMALLPYHADIPTTRPNITDIHMQLQSWAVHDWTPTSKTLRTSLVGLHHGTSGHPDTSTHDDTHKQHGMHYILLECSSDTWHIANTLHSYKWHYTMHTWRTSTHTHVTAYTCIHVNYYHVIACLNITHIRTTVWCLTVHTRKLLPYVVMQTPTHISTHGQDTVYPGCAHFAEPYVLRTPIIVKLTHGRYTHTQLSSPIQTIHSPGSLLTPKLFWDLGWNFQQNYTTPVRHNQGRSDAYAVRTTH